MRIASYLLLVGLFLVLSGVFLVGILDSQAAGGELDERWVSDTARETNINHHQPAVGQFSTGSLVFAPLSASSGSKGCAFTALSATDGAVQWRDPIPPEACEIHAVADPTIADFDGDGSREVLVATTEREIVAYDPQSGDKEFQYDLDSYGYTQPVLANLTGSAAPEIVLTDAKGTVYVLRQNETAVWTAQLGNYTLGQPAVADFDADGAPELVVGVSGAGTLTLFDASGSREWERSAPFGDGITWLQTGQADDDPALEAIAATGAGRVVAVDGRTGAVEWSQSFGALAAVGALTDTDGDGTVEVQAVAADGVLRSLNAATGEQEWQTTLTTGDVQMMPPPTAGDVDGDGDLELVAPSNDGIISVLDPETGDVLATHERSATIFTPTILADTDDDGVPELYQMYADGRVVSVAYRDS